MYSSEPASYPDCRNPFAVETHMPTVIGFPFASNPRSLEGTVACHPENVGTLQLVKN